MKAAIYPGHGRPIAIETIADPRPGAEEVLIRVHRCGICGTDLAMTRGGAWDFGCGVQFGHEYAGEIVEIGKEVSGWKPGDRIAVLPSVACGSCEICRVHGNNVLCRNGTGNASVGFAEYAAVPASLATRLPETLSMADGALIEPLAISLNGVRMAAIRPGSRVLVLGGGTVALYAIYWARRLRAGRIVAMSRSPRRRDACLRMGADAFVAFGESEGGDVTERLGGSADVVLECVGAEGMLARAMRHAAPCGRIVSLGFCTTPDPIIPAAASYKGLSLHFAVGYTMRDFVFIAELLDRDRLSGGGHVDPATIVTRQVGLDDLPATFDALRGSNEEIKVHALMG